MAVPDYNDIIEEAAREWDVDPHIIRAIMHQESGGKPGVVSRAGAVGLMQVMPKTGDAMGATDLKDVRQNIFAGTKYYSQLLDHYKRADHALGAYNAGPGRFDEFLAGKTALPAETLAYIPAVTSHYVRFKGDKAASSTPPSPSGAMSDEEFLKATNKPGDAGGGLPSDKEFLKATGETGKAPIAMPEAPPSAAPVPTGDMGGDVASVLPPTVAPETQTKQINALRQVGEAVASPFVEGSAVQQWVNRAPQELPGLFGNNLRGRTNRLILQGVALPAQGLEMAGKTIQGLARGAGTVAGNVVTSVTGDQTMGNRLSRDISNLPDAVFPAMGMMASGSRLAPPEAPTRHGGVPRVEAPPRALGAPGEPVAAGAGMPESVGAAATSPAFLGMSARDALAARKTPEGTKLVEVRDISAPQVAETIPGLIVTPAQRAMDVRLAREEAALERTPEGRQRREQVAAHNDDVLKTHFDEVAGNPNITAQLRNDLDETFRANERAVFGNKKPANVDEVRAAVEQILNSPEGVGGPVEKAMDSLLATMDRRGASMSDPEMLYGLRKNINQMIRGNGTQDAAAYRLAQSQLIAVRNVLDDVVEASAPGFKAMLKEYGQQAAPIEAMEFLQDQLPTLTDASGRLTHAKVQAMMKRIYQARSSRMPTGASSLTPEQMTSLYDIRDFLRDERMKDTIARGRMESNTTIGLGDAAKGVGRMGAHGIIGMLPAPLSGLGNVALEMGINKMTARGEARRLNRLIDEVYNPPPLRPRQD